MDIEKTFRSFCNKIHLDSISEFEQSLNAITKKLNRKYYDLENETIEHRLIVGSIGRLTAIKNVSDVDFIFELPADVFRRFDAYESNGQSALLQEIRNELLSRYPNTEIHGDGQVVSIEFSSYTIELVPGFRQNDNSFKYPDANDGGSWKITNPLPEQRECKKKAKETQNNYIHMCNILRIWKNNIGFQFKGLLIDTLVFDYLTEHPGFSSASYSEYIDFLTDVLSFLSGEDPEQKYWYALGSNQKIYNSDKGLFIRKASSSHAKLTAADTEKKKTEALKEILGREFSSSIVPKEDKTAKSAFSSNNMGMEADVAPHEMFIEDMFPVDIKWNLRIDCKVTQKGFRPFWLSSLNNRFSRWLSKDKTLNFQIESTDTPVPFDIYWKIRNCGPEAIRRSEERGEIVKGTRSKREHTKFSGDHYAECYLVKNGICVARAKVLVPINTDFIDTEHME